MKEKKEYMDLAKWTVEHASKEGADSAEALITDSQDVDIFVGNRSVERMMSSRDAGISIRILKDQKMIFGYSNELLKNSIKNMVSDLMKKVSFHTADEFNVIYGKEYGVLEGDWASYTDMLAYDPKIAEVSIEKKIKRAISLETGGLDYSPKILSSMWVWYTDRTSYVYLANSNGIFGCYPTSSSGGRASFSAAEGDDHQSGSYAQRTVKYDDFEPAKVGQKAAENAVRMLGARPIKSCEVPMVISPRQGMQFLSYLAMRLYASNVLKGLSPFAGKIGENVAAHMFTLIDDGKLKGGLATQPVDDEGVPRQTTPLIVDGILKAYLYDCYNAKKDKTRSTGNHRRSGRGRGDIGYTNLYLKAGKKKAEDIIAGIKDGFYLVDTVGMFAGIDHVSGDFSFPAAGFKIENGEITYPIRGITIGGNLFDFLKSIDKIGDDMTWFQYTGCPTFFVKSIKIGGE